MILSDTQLHAWAQYSVSPFDASLVNPASIDLRLGDEIRIAHPFGFGEPIKLYQPWRMFRGEFILAHTLEVITMPDDCAGMLFLKSTRGREGWEHSHAAYIDPGFSGQLTLELSNLAPWELLITPGMRICQLVLMRCVQPAALYGEVGHYQNQMGAVVAR